MNKKAFGKLAISVCAVAAGTLYLSGALTSGPILYDASSMKDGTYYAERVNQFSTVDVEISIENKEMKDVRISSSGAMDLMTDEIRTQWGEAILTSQSSTPDAITGATLTFSAGSVTEAVDDILAQARGEKEPEPAPIAAAEPEAAAEPKAAAEPETAAEPQAVQQAADSAVKDGTYYAERTNSFSTVNVEISIENQEMKDVRISSSGDMDLLTDEIRAEWGEAILASQSSTPDAVTGATLTFSAGSVTEAVDDILAQARGEKEPEPAPGAEAEPEPAAEPEAAAAPATEAETEPEPEEDITRFMRQRPVIKDANVDRFMRKRFL